jgi:carbon-monoxide dehydrogenase small subunit
MKEITVHLTVNSKNYEIQSAPNRTLLNLLREDVGLTGAKDGCGGEGECGACTVLLDGRPVNACLVLAGQADQREVVTVEDLASEEDLHPLQTAFVEDGAVQCGFCTPGAIMSAMGLLHQIPDPTEEQIREALSGNLCRCTGYTKMVSAVKDAAKEMSRE